jgi:Family of unknown function (DUF5947)
VTGALRRLAQRGHAGRDEPPDEAPHERCELCAEPIPGEHRHLLDRTAGRLRCACRACALVLDRGGRAGGRYRLVPERSLELPALAHDDARWADLKLPVSLAFLVRRESGGPVAIFPGALGPTDAPIEPSAWAALEAVYPAVRDMECDVEAVLVHRVRGAHECWIAPIDACYRLVALVRSQWRGIAGGDEVWREISRFFEGIRRQDTREMAR